LNNLMVAVMGNAGLALHSLPAGSPARGYVADIERATEKVTNFSKQILSFTSQAAQKKEPVQLNNVVEETAHFLMASISKTADLEYSLSEDLPAIIADHQNMQQVVMNLIINASDAIGDNNGTIKVSTGKMGADRKYLDNLNPAGLPEGVYAYVEVSDTGCGLSPETRRRIFEPFFTTKFTGRGLGLAAVFGIASAHGGAIALESEEGCGATFRVLLPVPEKPVEVISSKPVTEEIWNGIGRILVVDDEKDSLLMAKKVLEGAGYSVMMAMDGAEAIKIYRMNSDTISAVILDLVMPHVRGDAAAKEMRKIKDDVNILLLSGYHEIDLTDINSGPGKTAILEKPYKITNLLRAVQDILKD
jgi:two-component system, cell cycle sensor histidine kinase and response regulator CckA